MPRLLHRGTTTVGLALSLAAIDLGLGLARPGLPPSVFYLLAWAALCGTLCLLVLAAVGIAVRHSRRPSLPRAAAAAWLAAAIALLHVVYANSSELGVVSALAVLALATGISALVVRSLRRTPEPRSASRLDAVSRLLPWPLALGVAFLYLQRAAIQGLATPASLYASLVFVAAVSAVVLVLWRGAEPIRDAAVILLAVLLAVAVPVLMPRRSTTAGGAEAAGVRHILLITVDTFRADAVDCASDRGFARLCADGYHVRQAVAPSSWTLPSLVSLQTGLAQGTHGVEHPADHLPRRVPTLAQRLASAGYRTAAFGDSPFLESGDLGRGFEDTSFFPRFDEATSVVALLTADLGLGGVLPSLLRRTATATQLTDLALAWIRRHRDQPTFVWLHYYDPHRPYAPPRARVQGRPPAGLGYDVDVFAEARSGAFRPNPDQESWIRTLYAAEVEVVDHEVDRLLAGLDELHLYRDSLVMLTGDHGEEFWEHGGYEHGHSLYDEVVRVPLLVKLPAGIGGQVIGSEVRAPVEARRVAGTALDLAGVVAGPGVAPSLRSALEPEDQAAAQTSGCLDYVDCVAVFFGDEKYLVHRIGGEEELFDLGADPGESHPVRAPERLQEGRQRLATTRLEAAALRRRYGIQDTASERDLSPELRRKLRALGYLR